VSESGRYDRHPLVYSYTREKLAEQPAEKVSVEAKHAAFFSHFSDGLGVQFNGPYPKQTYQKLEAELENCRAAWRWAVDEQNADLMLGFANAFWFYYGIRTNSEALAFWEEAAAVLDESNPAHREALGAFLALQAQIYRRTQIEKAKTLAERGLKLLSPSKNRLGIAMCYMTLALAADLEGNFEGAIALVEESGQVLPSDLTGEMPLYIAHLEMAQGNYSAAKARLLSALQANKDAQFIRSVVRVLTALGYLHLHEDDFETARHYFQEGAALERQQNFNPGGRPEISWLLGLSEIALQQDRLEEATALIREALEDHERLGEWKLAAVLTLRGRIAVAQGNYKPATKDFKRALQGLTDLTPALHDNRTTDFSDVLLAFSELWVKQERHQQVATALGFLLRQLHVAHDRAFANKLLEVVRLELSSENLEIALHKGKALKLGQIVHGFLKDSL